MKAKVLKRFVDRETKQVKEEGRIYTFEEDRAKTLEQKGFVEILPEKEKTVEPVTEAATPAKTKKPAKKKKTEETK